MKHEYLHELFPDGKLPFPYSEEDYPDFDKRDTFGMDQVLVMWLYERLRYFEEEVSKTINLNYHKFDIDGEEFTQMQCIHRMVDDCAVIVKSDEFKEMEKMDAAKDDLFKVLSKVYWAMWW